MRCSDWLLNLLIVLSITASGAGFVSTPVSAQETTPPTDAAAEETVNEPETTSEPQEPSADSDSGTSPAEATEGRAEGTTETAPDPPVVADTAAATSKPDGIQQQIDVAFGRLNGAIASVMFVNVLGFPLAVLWLVLGAIYFTIRMGFINLRAFGHAIRITMGRYDDPEDAGEVSHFQALTAALSATVGLGNIAGVAIAIATGGPGATFWMMVAGLIGMSSKFVECTLGQKYRQVRPDGRVMGGAMYYLSNGLAGMGMAGFGKTLAVLFAILCIGGSFGGGCAFQVRQSLDAVAESVPFLKTESNHWVYGAVMTLAVGVVIVGGIRSIARVAEKIVPVMCGVYLLAATAIIVMNFSEVPAALGLIMHRAFSPRAVYGGFIGVLVIGFKRAAFSNEAGVGSAAIAHSAAKTDYPVREGIVALLEPFIDTVVICTMTALVIVMTGTFAIDFKKVDNKNIPTRLALEDTQHNMTEDQLAVMRDAIARNQGATLTSLAMDRSIPGFRFILAVAVCLFAYSTMISWSYYGERCWAWLFGDGASMVYRCLFLAFVFLGSIVSATNVLEFGDLMILGMAFPNIVGLVLLSGGVAHDLNDYMLRLRNGEFDQK